MNAARLSTGVRVGYGFGLTGESVTMNTFYIFFIFFLTEAAGVSPAAAGTISIIAAFWGACTDLFAGRKSDVSTNPKGRRRPFMYKAMIPLGIVVFLMYTTFPGLSDAAKFVYFLAAVLVFWLLLSFVDINYLSLGSEISDDYEERNTIRAIANVFNYGGMILASSGTLMLVVLFSGGEGVGNTQGWSMVGLVFGIIAFVAYFVAARVTKGKEPIIPAEEIEGMKEKNYLKSLLDVFSNKPFRYILIYTVFAYGAVILYTSLYIYYLMYNMGYTEEKAAFVMLIYSLMVIVISAILAQLGIRIDKRTVVVGTTILLGVVMCVFKFIGLTDVTLYFFFFCFALAISAFFVQVFSMVYDAVDLDEFVNGSSRDGVFVSVFYFIQKIVGGIAMFIVGWILTIVKYDPSLMEQSVETMDGIATGALLIPGIGFIIGALVMLKYPITKDRFSALRKAIEDKKEGKEYTTEGFNELL